MRHSRAHYVVLVGIGLLTICEPFTTKVIFPQPIDAAVDVIWLFVQCAAMFCVGADLTLWLMTKWRTQ